VKVVICPPALWLTSFNESFEALMALVKYRDWVQIGLVWLDEFTRADFRINFVLFFFWCNIPLKTRVFAVNLKFTVLMDSVCIRGSRPGWWIDIVGVSGV
jgi:hypothetical protein